MEAGRHRGGRIHVAMLSSPGIGHLAPLAELARRLAVRHGVSVTLMVSAADSSSPFYSALVDSLAPGVSAVALPESALSGPAAAVSFTSHVSLLPAVRRVLEGLKQSTAGGRLAALVVDFLSTDFFEVAADVGVPSFIFFPSNLFLLSLSLHLPVMHDAMPRLDGPVELPGCLPLFSIDIPEGVRSRGTERYEIILHHVRRYEKAEGILVNSFRAMEAETATIFSERKPGRPPVYLVGPLVAEEPPRDTSSPSLGLEWLDEQPNGSVLYICLGSLGVLNNEQVKEMAFGLEESGQRFLWVLRGLVTEDEDPVGCLPPGFVERTKGAGRVLTSWAPQLRILSHRAVGGFLTHCGWNSVQECVVHGRVPMIAWPLYNEQRMNALILVERLGVAIRTEGQGEDGVVRREAISAAVVELMKGERGRAARERVRALHAAAAAEEDASSTALADVVAAWKSK
ncbi:UDP-glycosyltransferase 72B1-like [Curcuma longa]|uniref:UDP-glycosyltransferase 72B1-like n=1 Tax=Curcuma longa TaxID=136217 RepID=UPI003D9DB643